jgi:hypothetical protein
MDASTSIHIIVTETEMLMSWRSFRSWRDVQDAYKTYKASLGPWSAEVVIECLAEECFNLSPSAMNQVEAFTSGSAETHVLTFLG